MLLTLHAPPNCVPWNSTKGCPLIWTLFWWGSNKQTTLVSFRATAHGLHWEFTFWTRNRQIISAPLKIQLHGSGEGKWWWWWRWCDGDHHGGGVLPGCHSMPLSHYLERPPFCRLNAEHSSLHCHALQIALKLTGFLEEKELQRSCQWSCHQLKSSKEHSNHGHNKEQLGP